MAKNQNIHKLRQKDVNASWTRKGNYYHYGCKDHVKADADSKLITDYTVTLANGHNDQRNRKSRSCR